MPLEFRVLSPRREHTALTRRWIVQSKAQQAKAIRAQASAALVSLHMTVKRKYVQNFRNLRFTDVLERATELLLVRQEVKPCHRKTVVTNRAYFRPLIFLRWM